MRELLRLLSTDALVLLERRLRRVAPTFMLPVIIAIRWELINRFIDTGHRVQRDHGVNCATRGCS